ncbi:putative acyl-CoA dehydrogenase [Parvularcula bermudensis HTCC2503]|uniref:Putative acyl-CoA dehydrogenase n=1 Tax=Parvularcula bermudensis (strain ATCC BAA-594 / HTCC2503 / KCTC 12087) TaxID=314260 RepID=E0TCQ8_PARBH|nr:acyl-CoA dehydrogenase [Parvularcula bermudensis]ADM08647.1 putative acyl-CoA dehydrogenase [Parvularcula bermudensis HTCC2503]
MYDRQDLTFQLFDVAKLDHLLAHPRFDALDRSAIEGFLDAADHIAETAEPLAARLDETPPTYRDGKVDMLPEAQSAFDALREAGLIGGPLPETYGGLGLPETVHQALAFVLSAANIGLTAHGMLTLGAARLIESFGTTAQKEKYLPPLAEGRFTGTMCLSEPHAGSSLADITTKAIPQEDGSYKIIGRKMWISGGDHELSENIIHLLLAKIPGGPEGIKGISLFIVPKKRVDDEGGVGERNDVALAGLNHKMGYKGITNCALNFGENEACIGELVGEPHNGLRYMFQMMNEARVAVGLGAAALGQSGYQASLAYAKERPQGRHPDEKTPGSGQIPIIEHADIRRLLLAQKAAVEPALALGLFCAILLDRIELGEETAETDALLLDFLTPIAKSWPSEFCLEANKHAIQVLGGAGYTKDYPVERLYRDNRLNPIHEGTHGIQGQDLLGRKVTIKGGAAAQAFVAAVTADLKRPTDDKDIAAFQESLKQALDRFGQTTMAILGKTQEVGVRRMLSNATLYLDFTGHLVMAWMWLRICLAAEEVRRNEGDSDFLKGKVQAARYFFNRELPRTKGWAETLSSLEDSAFAMQADWF